MPDTARPAGEQQRQSSLLGVARRLDKERRHLGGWRGPQVCAITGVTYRQLDYWARTGLARPSLAEAHGSGTTRRYSYSDLVVLAVIRALLDAGISLQSARRAITHLQDRLAEPHDLAATNLVLTGTDTLLATNGDHITELLRTSGGVLNILPLARVLHDLDTAINDLDSNAPTPTTHRPLETT